MTNTELAQKAIALLTKGKPPLREPTKTRPIPWLTAWRGIVDLVYGVTIEDPRMPAILAAITLCDVAFAADDWLAFERAAEAVRKALLTGPFVAQTARDDQGSTLAVRIGGSVVGDFWLVLSDTEPFDPGDGLPVYRPSEIRVLKGKGYGQEALQAIHRAKVSLEGEIR